LLLVVATGVIGSFLVAWANSSFAVQSLNITTDAANRINLIKESYVIEDVWFNGTSPNQHEYITIRNSGDLAIKVTKIYVNNTQVWSTGQTITAGSYGTITINQLAPAWGAGKAQSIWVLTERGTEAKQVWKS
jgi:hypothetical protein